MTTEQAKQLSESAIAKLMEQHGDASLPELLDVLADCPKAKAASV